MLSRVRKEILLKSVAQALPTYCMNVFLIPVGICDALQKMMNSFWWGMKPYGSPKIHWFYWVRMCGLKNSGGLGFRLLHFFNQAMFAKQGGNIMDNPLSLPA
ncbi:uncharacterized mitochondrial protein AtMg00310-like [Rutidosis leptorrhynchoides]|uniref:uncharacterized mitochondrial protein AtMg00310-like n=1 Tax=Rutidosis leptorrhynchoides TaxID=125765 RepID=UPI003A99638D